MLAQQMPCATMVLLFVLVLSPDGNAQHYELRSGSNRSNAVLKNGHLEIQSGRTSYRYERREAYDSKDGRYLAFHEPNLDKTIRFPVGDGGRIQVLNVERQWEYSLMEARLVSPVVPRPAGPTITKKIPSRAKCEFEQAEEIDRQALEIQEQVRELASEAREHYQSTGHYRQLSSHILELAHQAKHIHELAHDHGDVDHIAEDLSEMDASFHHLEEVFHRIENEAALGLGSIRGPTLHVKELLESMENNIHSIQRSVKTLRRQDPGGFSVSQPRPVSPIEVTLRNSGPNDLTVTLHTKGGNRAAPVTFEIPAGRSVQQRVVADHENTLYVSENVVTSMYIDRTGGDPLGQSVTTSQRSMGAFRLPQGRSLQRGSIVHVYRSAVSADNPGAARP